MIEQLHTIDIFVTDKQTAIDFYVEKLGFEVRDDVPFPAGSGITTPDGALRWVTVAPPGGEFLVVLVTPEFFVYRPDRVGERTDIRLRTDDLSATHHALAGRGVRFTQRPRHTPNGWEAWLADQDGNELAVVQAA